MSDELDRLSRRRFLQSMGFVASGTLIVGCGGNDDSSGGTPSGPCTELTDLSTQQKQQRQRMVKSLNYVTESPNDERCDNCQLYLSKEYGESCGGCQLFPGPVFPGGYCDSWMKTS